MPITALPPAPSRADPANFSNKADAWVGAIDLFTTEANALAADVNNKQTIASTAATTASTQAGIATTKANEANSSAIAADASATLASQWATKLVTPVQGGEYSAKYHANEAAVLTEKYQGSLTSDPTLDKSGNPITAGDWYINSTTGFIRAYNGTSWVQGISATAGVSSINGESGDVIDFIKTSGAQSLSTKKLISPRYNANNVGTTSSSTLDINYNNGPLVKVTIGSNISNTVLSNLPASGTLGHLKLMLVNPGAYTITFPTSWKFIKNDFSTTSFLGLGITLPSSGVVFMDLITDDGGSNVYVTISRN